MGVGHLGSTATVVAGDGVCGQSDDTVQETVASTLNTAGKRGLAYMGRRKWEGYMIISCTVQLHAYVRR